ncbi:hypothetical protein ES332_A01G174100v1 [Gossypium tomentosum]|uniref:Uncharacterized protein n=1 Tax=Gossypium tomentosum TaxID=34277 RepID=A0A5D2RRR2_GOSTO|nr:hypothetical protein ES332_A01G174100v1 [Gossypium tomentosum]
MCTSPAVHPSNCGINDDVDARKGKTSSAAVIKRLLAIKDDNEEL